MTQDPVLRRKVLRPRPHIAPEPVVSDLARMMPRAMMRAVSVAASLTAEVGAVTETRLSLDEVLDRISDDGFVALLGLSAGGGGTGLVVLQQGLFSALIEAMTLGRLSSRMAEPRRPTATDSALLGAVVDQTLRELAPVLCLSDMENRAVGLGKGGPDARGGQWQMSRSVSDLRLLGALMDDGEYRMLTASVRLTGNGAERDGGLTFLLPLSTPPVAGHAGGDGVLQPSVAGSSGRAGGSVRALAAANDDPFQKAFELAVMAAPVQLGSVLGRVPMTLHKAMALKVGQRLELPLSQLEEVEVIGLDGTLQARARLGQSRGMRALRIVALCDPAGGAGLGGAVSAGSGEGFISSQGQTPVKRVGVDPG